MSAAKTSLFTPIAANSFMRWESKCHAGLAGRKTQFYRGLWPMEPRRLSPRGNADVPCRRIRAAGRSAHDARRPMLDGALPGRRFPDEHVPAGALAFVEPRVGQGHEFLEAGEVAVERMAGDADGERQHPPGIRRRGKGAPF